MLRLTGSTLIVPLSVWQLTRVGGLHRVKAHKCTVFGKTSVFDLLVELYVDRHSLNGEQS